MHEHHGDGGASSSANGGTLTWVLVDVASTPLATTQMVIIESI